jgi:hypothetical protein
MITFYRFFITVEHRQLGKGFPERADNDFSSNTVTVGIFYATEQNIICFIYQ